MRSRSTRSASVTASGGVASLVVFIGCDPAYPGELPWPARAALEVADVVLYDRDVASATLALVPSRCFAEPMPPDAGEGAGLARAGKLAGEGWRVVRLVVGDPAASASAVGETERLAAAGIATRTLSGAVGGSAGNLPGPQPLATALNGLAG